MKKDRLKLALAAFAVVGMISTISCEKEENSDLSVGKDAARQLVDPIIMDSSSVQLLDELFSRRNPNLVNYQPDTVYIINSSEQLSQLGGNGIIPNINLEENSIIWGCIYVPDGSHDILSKELSSNGQSYTMDVTVIERGVGTTMPMELFFWGVYPKIESTVLLNVIFIS